MLLSAILQTKKRLSLAGFATGSTVHQGIVRIPTATMFMHRVNAARNNYMNVKMNLRVDDHIQTLDSSMEEAIVCPPELF